MFKPFTFEEVVAYAESLGYTRDCIEVRKYCSEYDYDLDAEVDWEYEVSFGHEYTETWSWTFEDLNEEAVDYEHTTWED